jgi:hypothetical protein
VLLEERCEINIIKNNKSLINKDVSSFNKKSKFTDRELLKYIFKLEK